MHFIKYLCFVFAPLFLLLNTPAFAYIEKDTAVLRVMNKAAGKTQVVSGKVGSTIQHNGLIFKIRNCKQTDPFDAENYFVFLEIYTKTDDRIFSGWMNHNEPGQNPLQNDTYDVWLEKCE
jgi:hypothetical protein